MDLRPIDYVDRECEFCKRDTTDREGKWFIYTCILRSNVATNYPCMQRHQYTCRLARLYQEEQREQADIEPAVNE